MPALLTDIRTLVAAEKTELQRLRERRERLAAELDALSASIIALKGSTSTPAASARAPAIHPLARLGRCLNSPIGESPEPTGR
jgi:hypothetical protein